jgi:hypothetical protein
VIILAITPMIMIANAFKMTLLERLLKSKADPIDPKSNTSK